MATLSAVIFYVLLCIVTLFLVKIKSKTWKKTIDALGLSLKKISIRKTIGETLLLFFAIFAVLTIEALLLSLVNFDDSSKVSAVISTFSIPAIIVASTLGPFSEELFFRGFLQKHTGVFISAALFALLHFSFGSAVEMLGALTAGLIFGYWVKYRNPSLWPVVLSHALYNTASIFIVLVVK